MRLIERYIALRVTKMAIASILPVLAVIWIVQVLGRINLVTDSGQSIGSFATLAALILPTILPMVIPFGIVIGVAQTLAAMNADFGTCGHRQCRRIAFISLEANHGRCHGSQRDFLRR